MTYFIPGFIVGVAGDAFLQYKVNKKENESLNHALSDYFEKWGSLEALMAAGLLTGSVSYLIGRVTRTNMEFISAAVIIDDLYREYHRYIYPSLDSYYETYDRNSTRLYNAVTAGLVLLTDTFI